MWRNRFLSETRLLMRSWRLESETPQLFRTEASRDLLHTKNVIELSVLRRGSGASSAEEYE
jgi:hypothetical protein